MQRDQSTLEDATSRLKSQMPIEDKVAYANAILNNSGTLEELSAQVDLLVEHLRRAAGWSWRVSWILPPIGLLSAVLTLAHRAFKRRQGSTKKED
jgi:dephospho-CoA kinase